MSAQIWKVEPSAASLGATVHGVDMQNPPADFSDALPSLLAQHGVLAFRSQALSPETVIDVASRLGELEGGVMDQFSKPGYPKIYVLSNIVENGRAIGSATDGYGWHTDQGYLEYPTAYTLLYGIETPPEGADTLFTDTRGAWNSLSPERQAELLALKTRHSFESMISDRAKQPEFVGKVPALTEKQRNRVPEVVHPLVRRHPVDQSLGLYLGGQTLVEMIGLSEAQSRQLTEELFELCTAERFQFRHVWQTNDLVIWDNRLTLHCATPFDRERYRRLMWRVSVKGERPLASV